MSLVHFICSSCSTSHFQKPIPLYFLENTSVDLHSKKFEVTVGGQLMLYTDVTPAMVKTMTKEERENYVRVGKLMFTNLMLE